jgi:YNFM family putative membrane transporter
MAGRLLIGVMADFWGWRSAMLAMAGLGMASAAVLYFYLPASRNFVRGSLGIQALAQTYKAKLRDSVLVLLFVEGFLAAGGFVTIYNYAGYRLLAPPFSLSQTQIGLVFTIYLSGVASSACTGSLATRVGRQRVLPAAFGLMLLGTLLTLAGTLWVIVAGITILTVGFFAAHSVLSAWVGAQAKAGRAQATSLYLFAYYFGSSVVGSLGGVFWSWGGWTGVISMTSLFIVAALAIACRLRRQPA